MKKKGEEKEQEMNGLLDRLSVKCIINSSSLHAASFNLSG